jgi:hypothetical protein
MDSSVLIYVASMLSQMGLVVGHRMPQVLYSKYEEESKSNLNMAIKSQNHVVDGCTTDMLCPPA